MKPRTRRTGWVCATTIAALVTSPLQAANLFWEGTGVVGGLTDANYFNAATSASGEIPTAADVLHIGGQGVVTLSIPDVAPYTYSKLRVGHNQTTNVGPGTLTVSDGAQINLTGGASDGTGAAGNGANAALWVGNRQNGSVLTIDGAGTSVTSNHGIVIGIGNGNPGRTGTVHVTNGGSLIATAGQIKLGERVSGSTEVDVPRGNLFVNGTVQAVSLYVGMRDTTSTYTQTGGVVNFTNVVEVAPATSGSPNKSTFSISGGTFTNGGHFFLGRGASTGATMSISGTGEVNVGDRFLVGAGTATGVVVDHSGGTLNAGTDVRIGDGGNYSGDSTYNLRGTGILNSTAGGIVGRQGTNNKFIQTGGTANFGDALAIGHRADGAGPASGLYKISAGTLNAGAMIGTTALNIAPDGSGEFRVVGDDAEINLYGNVFVNNDAVNGRLGTLAFELESGDLLSTINVTDSATFSAGSKLVFDVSNSLPTQTTYDLLTAQSITDSGLVFEGPAGWSYQIVTGGAGQILQATGPLIAPEDADFDADGDVDGADFLAWQRNVSKTSGATPAQGDANGDQAVDGDDLTIWKGQFGPASVAASAPVPEPSAIALALFAAAACGAAVRRGRARRVLP